MEHKETAQRGQPHIHFNNKSTFSSFLLPHGFHFSILQASRFRHTCDPAL